MSSIIPTALGGGQRLDQLMMATDVFDTPGTSSWTHPSPGTALEVQVTLVGGAGGGAIEGGGDGTDGGNTIWDINGSTVIASSGSKAVDGSPGNGFIKGTETTTGTNRNKPTLLNGLYGNSGYPTLYSATHAAYEGGSGEVVQFRTTVSNDITVIVGAGGVVGAGSNTPGITDSQAGAVIVQYAKAAVGIPAPVQKEFVEEWLDWDSTVSGSGTWTHPRPGQAIEMTVICVGGAGGNAIQDDSSGAGADGVNTVFDTITATGGKGGSDVTDVAPVNDNGATTIYQSAGTVSPTPGFGYFGQTNGATTTSATVQGSPGSVKIGRITVTGNVSYSVGNGGAEGDTGAGNGLSGGIILKYSY